MNALEEQMRYQLKLALVQKAIFCPVSTQVLDVRTCVVLVDTDGDPAAVLSQIGYQDLVRNEPEKLAQLREAGYTVDESTIAEKFK